MKTMSNGAFAIWCFLVCVLVGSFIAMTTPPSTTSETITTNDTYELCNSSVTTGNVTEGSVGGLAILGTGLVMGSTSTEFINIYRLTYITSSNAVKIVNLREDASGVIIRIYASIEGDAVDFEPTVNIECTYTLTTYRAGFEKQSNYLTTYTITVHKDTIYNI